MRGAWAIAGGKICFRNSHGTKSDDRCGTHAQEFPGKGKANRLKEECLESNFLF